MKNTIEFVSASPAQKEVMLKDGLLFLATEMDRMRMNLNRLRQWLARYPALIEMNDATINDYNQMGESIRKFVEAMDNVGVAFVNTTMDSNNLLQYLLKKYNK
jgi:hypothetical protein